MDSQQSKKRRKSKRTKYSSQYVVYVAHLPHGFTEDELNAYFSQFGKIKRLRLARSSKTGGSKGFAYIQFEFDEVSKTVVEAMNNYLFFEKLLKCELVPVEKLHKRAFYGWKKNDPLRSDINRKKQNSFKDESHVKKSATKRDARLKKLNETLNKMGINHSFTAKSDEKK